MTATLILDELATWPAPNVAAGWAHGSGRLGLAGTTQSPYALASITKLLTAAAVLVAVQEEVVDLDEPAGPPGATVRHLLAHASGLGLDGMRPLAPPGQRRIYGNVSFEMLGDLVAERAGMPFDTYVAEALCEPLSMTATELRGSPAHGGVSTVEDLLRFVAELLRPGAVLAPEIVVEARTPQFPDLDGVLPGFGRQRPNPWGLGFEVRGTKHPHWTPPESSPATFGHFGQSGGFLWVDPEADVAAVVLTDHPFGDWAIEAWPRAGRLMFSAASEE